MFYQGLGRHALTITAITDTQGTCQMFGTVCHSVSPAQGTEVLPQDDIDEIYDISFHLGDTAVSGAMVYHDLEKLKDNLPLDTGIINLIKAIL